MALVLLPGLNNLIDDISDEKKLAPQVVEAALREALQAEAEARLAAEQAARAEEDARLRELYPLPEDEEELGPEEDVESTDYAIDEAGDVEEGAAGEAEPVGEEDFEPEAADADADAEDEAPEEEVR